MFRSKVRFAGPSRAWTLCVLLFACRVVAAAPSPRTLTFEERVAAQEAVDRVYYRHQVDATKPFEAVMPRASLEAKVRTVLEQSAALEAYWGTSVTDEMLQREMERMAADTRMPERLQEMFAALGNDAFLVKECLARATLVDRLARNFFTGDRELHAQARAHAEELQRKLAAKEILVSVDRPERHVIELADDARRSEFPARVGEPSAVRETAEAFGFDVVIDETPRVTRVAHYAVPKMEWDTWWEGARRTLDAGLVTAVADVRSELPAPSHARAPRADGCDVDDTWDSEGLADLPEPRTAHSAVWTGSVMVIWGGRTNNNGSGYGLDTGGRYDPATDTWSATSRQGAPLRRSDHVAVWTGTEMIVWGGLIPTAGGYANDGARYNPVSDTWTPMTIVDAPQPRCLHTAVWTGSEMIVWGGEFGASYPSAGGRYNPATDKWTPTSTVGAPVGRDWPTSVWTGSSMIVWGGAFWNGTAFSYLNTGGRYDPASDTWTATSLTGAPAARNVHTAVWSGSRMIVWGGWNGTTTFGIGGRYDPITDSWTAVSTTNAPSGRRLFDAVWTGSQMIVFGGRGQNSETWNSGGRYDPVADTWLPTQLFNAPSQRSELTAVWTGTAMIVWGGQWQTRLDTGGRYNPATNTWTPTAVTPPIDARFGHTAVWTGNTMIVWGGQDSFNTPLNTGARFDPALDTWSPTTIVHAPATRYSHTAVWTGDEMIVWGGTVPPLLDTGGRYNPLTNSWIWTSTIAAPLARIQHKAFWTGSRMLVWGGLNNVSLASGALYDPVSDTWTPTSSTNAPTARHTFVATWSGTEMIVWSGFNSSSQTYLDTGSRYNPGTDSWTAISTTGAPTARGAASAVWAGSKMIVWGGVRSGTLFATGGAYDPVADTWTATATAGAPAPRWTHTMVWTGHVMIVWGGSSGFGLSSGGRYNPATNTWAATSLTHVPSDRMDHSAVWTGDSMIVWGGHTDDTAPVRSGGRYRLAPVVDDDLDGISVCAGDCDDTAASVHPGAQELCNGIDDNCDQLTDNGITAPTGVPALIEAKSGGSSQLSWSAVVGATRYDVVGGSLTALRAGAGNFTSSTTGCLGAYATPVTVEDAAVPDPGDGTWHLVRPVNACGGIGSYNDGASQPVSRDGGINASPWSCP